MSKFLPQKKKLLEEVYEKAENNAIETSFSGVLKYLERTLLDDFKISLSYRSFEMYYKTIVENDEDYNIRPSTLDGLSRYLGYNCFKEYCLEWKTVEHTVNHTISKVVINIVNKPFVNLSELVNKNKTMGAGIFGTIALCGFWINNTGVFKKKECMYWAGSEYKLMYCEDRNPNHRLIPADAIKLQYFKEITRPDTLTIENSKGKVWYDKSNNNIKFFTSYGENPENGKTLKAVSEYIIETYAGNE